MNDAASIRCVAVTEHEWLLWIELGALRCADRIVEIQMPLAPGDLERLLSPAPSFKLSGDWPLVIALLREGDVQRMDGGELDLGTVAEFFPLTERGAKALARTAKSAGVQFAAPPFEEAFQHRRQSLRLRFEHSNAMRFVEAAGFQLLDLGADHLRAAAEAITRKPKTFPKIERKRNRVYFGWALSLTQLGERMPADRWRDIRRRLSVEEFLKSLGERPANRAPIATEPDVRRFAGDLRRACAEAGIDDCLILRDSVVAHWADFLEMSGGSGMEEEKTLRALGNDLRVVEADEGQQSAAFAAYCIARGMHAETVSHLFYARRPSDFPCLKLSIPQGWMGVTAIPLSELPEASSEATSVAASVMPSPNNSVAEPGDMPSAESTEKRDLSAAQPPAAIQTDSGSAAVADSSGRVQACASASDPHEPQDHDGVSKPQEGEQIPPSDQTELEVAKESHHSR